MSTHWSTAERSLPAVGGPKEEPRCQFHPLPLIFQKVYTKKEEIT
jgi:hypothetical protein